MGATSMKQLQAQMMKRLRGAMERAKAKSESIMVEEIGGFYAGGTPARYKRTGQMMDTPETEGVFSSGASASFTARLNQSGGYTTGKQPSMAQVLDLTNYGESDGLYPAVGAPGYWERAEARIKAVAAEEIAKAFN